VYRFQEYLDEMAATAMPEPPARDSSGKPKVMSGKEAMQHFGRPTMNAIMRHPLYKKHIYPAEHQGFAHTVEKSSAGSKYDMHTVHVATGGKGIRHRVDFHIGMSGRKVTHTDHYVNKDNEKYPEGHPASGQVKWKVV